MIDYATYLKSRRKPSLPKGWAGASLQHVSMNFMKPLETQDYAGALDDYREILDLILRSRFEHATWILQHEKPQHPWLPPHLPRTENFEPLYEFFGDEGIDSMFGGMIEATYSKLKRILPCLIQYACWMHYQDLVLRHPHWDVIIKLGHHFTIDLIADNAASLAAALQGLPLERINVVPYRQQ